MTSRRFDSSSVRSEDDNPSGLSMSAVLMLPDAQRRIVQWMLRQPECTLSEIAAHLGEDEAIARTLLDDLVDQDFVQEMNVGGTLYYRTKLASRRTHQQLPDTIQQALAPGSPLSVILNPSGDTLVMAGSTFELCVTVSNKGNQSALIDIYIDEVSQLLRQWCASPYERLALGSSSSSEVVFEFQIPPQALPGAYSYEVVVDAPQHYPEDTPMRYTQRLQILPPIEEAVRVSDPTFTVQPVTHSQQPTILQPGQVLQMTITVYNRSDRVDRFWLTCTDLDESWLTVRYPEGLPLPGLVTTMDGLDLNPDSQGEILLLLHPPLTALAGNYFPTLRVHSANSPELMLLDVVYLQVLPVYLLNIELRTLVGKVRRMAGLYEIRLHNNGNIPREMTLQAVHLDEDELCTYTLEPAWVRILPGSTTISMLQVQPTKGWRRPFFGGGLVIPFGVELEDIQQYPLPNDLPQGTLIWEARPWWQLLLLLLAGLGILGAIAFLLWWAFFKPPAPPRVMEFAASSPLYQEADNDVVRLNWQISNPRQLQQISIKGQAAEGTIAVQPLVYNFSQGIPNELKAFCTLQRVLTCQNVRTDARQPGEYVFELDVFSRRSPDAATASLKTNTINIIPVDLPKITEFRSTQPTYTEASNNPQNGGANSTPGETILLNWKINNPNQLQTLRLIGRSPDGSVNSPLQEYSFNNSEIPAPLRDFCTVQEALECTDVPTGARQPGDYIFELSAIPQKGQGEPSSSLKTDTIKITPQRVPLQIINFQVNNEPARTKYIIPINPQQPPSPLTLSWQVRGGQDMKVEFLPSPGTVPNSGSISYPISQQPTREILTLKITNSLGDELSRSVTIETFTPPPVEAAIPGGFSGLNPRSADSSSQPSLPPPPPSSLPPFTIPIPPTTSGDPSASPSEGGASPSASPSEAGASPSSGSSSSPSEPVSPSEPSSLPPSELPPRFD